MTVIAVLDWMTPVMKVPAMQARDRRAGDLGQQRAHLVDRQRLDAVAT